MNIITQTLQTINFIRQEKTPPLGSYCNLLALGSVHPSPMTLGEICDALNEDSQGGRALDTLERNGMIVASKNDKNRNIYSLTDKGVKEVRRIVAGKLTETQQKVMA